MSDHVHGQPPQVAARKIHDWTAVRGVALLRALTLAALAALSACTPQPHDDRAQPPPMASAPSASPHDTERATPPSRESMLAGEWDVDLQRDERRGGHTIARHVGRTDAQLQARLRRESISAASTYPDLETAERAVRRTLDENARRVQVWIDRRASKPNLAIRHRARDGLPVGRILARGDTQSKDAHGAVVVLRWRGEGWYVLTSYPEDVR